MEMRAFCSLMPTWYIVQMRLFHDHQREATAHITADFAATRHSSLGLRLSFYFSHGLGNDVFIDPLAQ